MKKNKNAMSLIIALMISLIMIIVALYILEYMVPFMRNTKGIENSIRAYYFADSGIEDALLFMSGADLGEEKHKKIINKKGDYAINMTASGIYLPPEGRGNSEFDKDFNIIRTGTPIQIEIGHGKIDPDKFELKFQIPDFDNDSTTNLKLKNKDSNGEDIKYINWQISSQTNTLNASGSQILANEINGNRVILKDRKGRDLNDADSTFKNFYNGNCDGAHSGCILKLSILNKLELENGNTIPYLEWKIYVGETGGTPNNPIPLRYTIIKTKGRSFDFEKTLEVKIPQTTLNEAYDFTVFQ